jgi:signal peptidase II
VKRLGFTKLQAIGLGVALLAIILDQISKPLMRDWLASGDRQLTPFLSLVSAWNKGIGFSMLTMSQASGPYLLSGLALVIAAVMLAWLFRTHRLLPALSLGLIVGGALGNVIDRLRLGAVFDFIDLHLAGYHWPAFNLADSALSIGVVLLIIDGLFEGGGRSKTSARLEG